MTLEAIERNFNRTDLRQPLTKQSDSVLASGTRSDRSNGSRQPLLLPELGLCRVLIKAERFKIHSQGKHFDSITKSAALQHQRNRAVSCHCTQSSYKESNYSQQIKIKRFFETSIYTSKVRALRQPDESAIIERDQ